MLNARLEARLLVSGIRALIREGGEQGPPGGSNAAPQRVAGLRVFLVRGHRSAGLSPDPPTFSAPPLFVDGGSLAIGASAGRFLP